MKLQRRIVAALALVVMGARSEIGELQPDPKVTFRVQLTAAEGLPLDGWAFSVVPEGTTPRASQIVTSSPTGLLSFDVPMNYFRPPPAPQTVVVQLADERGQLQIARRFGDFFAPRSPLGKITGPFAAGDTVVRSLPLVAGAVATGTILATGAESDVVTFLHLPSADVSLRRRWTAKAGHHRIDGLPRTAGASVLVGNHSSRRLITLDLSSGSGDWGVVDLPAPAGSSRLRLRVTDIPTAQRGAAATVVSITTQIAYIASNADKSGVLMGRPANPDGLALPPGEYLIFIDPLVGDEVTAALTRLRDGVAFDPTRIPRVTLVEGQTTDLQLSYAEWAPKRLEVISASAIAQLAQDLLQNPPSVRPVYFPPGFDDPNAPLPPTAPPGNP